MSAFNIIFTGLGKLSVENGEKFSFSFDNFFLFSWHKNASVSFNTLFFHLRNSFYTNDYSNMMRFTSHLFRTPDIYIEVDFLAQFC